MPCTFRPPPVRAAPSRGGPAVLRSPPPPRQFPPLRGGGGSAGEGGPLRRARTREGSWSVDAGIVHRLFRGMAGVGVGVAPIDASWPIALPPQSHISGLHR